MKFRCDQCNAQYMIADEKVGKKGVKVRCKKCGFVITIRSKIENESPTEAQQQKSSPEVKSDELVFTEPTKTDLQSFLDDDHKHATIDGDAEDDEELGQITNTLLADEGGEEDSADLDRQSTRLFNVEEIRRVQAERVQASLEAIERREISTIDQPKQAVLSEEPDTAQQTDQPSWLADAEPERLEWYVAIDDQQIGPVSLGELSKRRERGELGPETLVWKAGLDDWMPVVELDELRVLMTIPAETSNQETQPEGIATDQQEPIQIGWVADDAKSPDTVDFSSRETAYDTAGVESSASENVSVGMDLDWKPTAFVVLHSLAQEELAALRPVDPQPEEEPPPSAGESSTEKAEGASVTGTGEGGASIIDQIKADDAASLRSAEKKQTDDQHREGEAAAQATRTAHEDEARVDNLPARRGQSPERLAFPPEPYPTHRASVPNWVVAMLAASGLVIVLLLGFIAYRLFENPRSPPSTTTANQPSPPSAGMQPALAAPHAGQPSEQLSPAAGPNTVMTASNQAPGGQPMPQTNPNLSMPNSRGLPAAIPGTQPPSPQAGGFGNDPAGSQKVITIEKAKNRPASPTKPTRAADDAPRVAERAKAHEETLPPPTQASARSKGDVLDFGDEGTKPVVKVDGDKPKELPPLSNVDVMDVMRKHMSEFQACSQKDSSVKGKMMVSFVIINDGTVSKISTLSEEFRGSTFSECISSLIKNIRFPKFGGEPKTVPFPFTVK